jgi:7,8-dihydroneopterin aldolase/epimerase/oxygenase
MDRIELHGIEVFGHHGVFEHEREHGQRFVVDLAIGADLSTAAASDRLEDTVDYTALVAAVVGIAGGEPVDLLETLAARIADACLAIDGVDVVEVTVHKPAAQLRALVGDVTVSIRRVRT